MRTSQEIDQNLRSSPPMYFMVISQWPQTADTIMNNFLPRRPRTAGPRYLPSTTKPITPSSISSITKWWKMAMVILAQCKPYSCDRWTNWHHLQINPYWINKRALILNTFKDFLITETSLNFIEFNSVAPSKGHQNLTPACRFAGLGLHTETIWY